MTALTRFQEALVDALFRSFENKRFSADLFFTHWFEGGQSRPYFFLFKKNLSVTNIQFAELLALIGRHSRLRNGPTGSRDFQFLSSGEFKRASQALVDSFPQDSPHATARDVAVRYGDLFQQTIVVDAHFGSCAISTPPNITLDLADICFYSGYVHSCGYVVRVRNLAKTHDGLLAEAINEYLTRNADPPDARFFFVPYCHEDFTAEDADKRDILEHGLDDVKLNVEKFYLGRKPLALLLRDLQASHPERIVVPAAGPYTTHSSARREARCVEDRTLWLIVEREVGESLSHPGPARYLICYDQRFINSSPFHLFDENKPAWLDHTTIPHTLMGAMINLTIPGWPTKGPVVIADPFAGTGTTWLELLKFPKSEVTAKCSDLNPASEVASRDNLDFFAMTAAELDALRQGLEAPGASAAALEAMPHCMRVVGEAAKTGRDPHFDPLALEELRASTFTQRLPIYLALRVIRRHGTAFHRGSESWEQAYSLEVRRLGARIRRLAKAASYLDSMTHARERTARHVAVPGTYSPALMIDPMMLRAEQKQPDPAITVVDVMSAGAQQTTLRPRTCDVIVCDPPYGFNTEETPSALATLYDVALQRMIEALRDGGQLVLCLLSRNHIGKGDLYFSHPDIVKHKVFAVAHASGRHVYQMVGALPTPAGVFRPPYYWESERALRRSILHFSVRDRPADPGATN